MELAIAILIWLVLTIIASNATVGSWFCERYITLQNTVMEYDECQKLEDEEMSKLHPSWRKKYDIVTHKRVCLRLARLANVSPLMGIRWRSLVKDKADLLHAAGWYSPCTRSVVLTSNNMSTTIHEAAHHVCEIKGIDDSDHGKGFCDVERQLFSLVGLKSLSEFIGRKQTSPLTHSKLSVALAYATPFMVGFVLVGLFGN